MASASSAVQRQTRKENIRQTRELVVASGETIYEGTLFGRSDTGEAIDIDTSKIVAGVAFATKEETETVEGYFGLEILIDLPSVSKADIGKIAYAADNNTAQLSSNTAILGPIVDVQTDKAWVHLTFQD